jgi:hypothetical protein
VLLLSCI